MYRAAFFNALNGQSGLKTEETCIMAIFYVDRDCEFETGRNQDREALSNGKEMRLFPFGFCAAVFYRNPG